MTKIISKTNNIDAGKMTDLLPQLRQNQSYSEAFQPYPSGYISNYRILQIKAIP